MIKMTEEEKKLKIELRKEATKKRREECIARKKKSRAEYIASPEYLELRDRQANSFSCSFHSEPLGIISKERADRIIQYRNDEKIALMWTRRYQWGITSPETRKKANPSRPLRIRGLMLSNLYEICEEINPFKMIELMEGCLFDLDVWARTYYTNCSEEDLLSKKADKRKERIVLSDLRKGENPYSLYLVPNLSQVFDIAIKKGYCLEARWRNDDSNSIKYYKFLDSYEKWIMSLDLEPWQL